MAVMMTCSYVTVAYGRHVSWQLLGVAFAAFQGGLGEASCLALCSLYDSRRALTLWSSGTGFAGKFPHDQGQYEHGCFAESMHNCMDCMICTSSG